MNIDTGKSVQKDCKCENKFSMENGIKVHEKVTETKHKQTVMQLRNIFITG